jgi:hypothetical protein
MERFANTQERAARRDELLDAIHGAGAFRNFRSTARRLRIEEEWFSVRHSAFEGIALRWLQAHGISFR